MLPRDRGIYLSIRGFLGRAAYASSPRLRVSTLTSRRAINAGVNALSRCAISRPNFFCRRADDHRIFFGIPRHDRIRSDDRPTP